MKIESIESKKILDEALNYAKAAYGKDFENPVLVVEKIQVGNGWELVDRDIIYDISLQKENSDELH